MNETSKIFQILKEKLQLRFPVLLCFYSGVEFPEYCAPMMRNPLPKIGMNFGEDFDKIFCRAVEENTAIHDGAVMLGRPNKLEPYKIMGWSFRLFPPENQKDLLPNKGSAFNSCLAMSSVLKVDQLFLLSGKSKFAFSHGKIINFVEWQ